MLGPLLSAQVEPMWGTAMTAPSPRQEGPGAIVRAVEQDSAEGGVSTPPRRGPGVQRWSRAVKESAPPGALLGVERPRLGTPPCSWQSRAVPGWQEARTFVGITRSPACVRAPAGNGWAERCIRTLQEPL